MIPTCAKSPDGLHQLNDILNPNERDWCIYCYMDLEFEALPITENNPLLPVEF